LEIANPIARRHKQRHKYDFRRAVNMYNAAYLVRGFESFRRGEVESTGGEGEVARLWEKTQKQKGELEEERARVGRRNATIEEQETELEEERARVGRRNATIEEQETELYELRGQVDWRDVCIQEQARELAAERARADRRDNLRDEIAELRGQVCKSNARLREVEDEIGELQLEVNCNKDKLREQFAQLVEPPGAERKVTESSGNGAGAGEEEQLADLRQDLAARSARTRSGGRSPADTEDSAGESPSGEDSADEGSGEEREVMERLRGAAEVLRLGTAEGQTCGVYGGGAW
jgi:DNA repair exonuclease SbcCD ATPase subunit